MSAYFPRNSYPDDFEFRFKVKAMDSCVAFGQTFYILEGILFEPSDPVEYCMYVSLGTLGSYRPEIGDNVEGVAWLQGHLAQ